MNDLFKGEKVVLASTMALFEKKLIEDDSSLAETFMDRAAAVLYEIICQKIFKSHHFSRVVLLVGKGNNGADAYCLGSLLLSDDLEVVAYQVYEEVSYLCAKKGAFFEENGGARVLLNDINDLYLQDGDLIIDGLFGTQFKGELSSLTKGVIKHCNESKGFVLSIDIASGVDGDTGMVKEIAINADMTGYLGALKVGHLFEDGLIHAGILQFVDFGLDIETMKGEYYLVDPSEVYQTLPKRSLLDNKYTAGELCVIAGSDEMHGAAELACKAAYRAGCGLVRHFYTGKVRVTMDEVISTKLNLDHLEEKMQQSKAYLIGPGLGRSEEARLAVEKVMGLSHLKGVIDADALFNLDKPHKGAVLTPHKGEILRLLKLDKQAGESAIHKKAKEYCQKYQVIIVYKGMPTVIFSPGDDPLVAISGNPGMAKAGCGDVLSGIIASFIAGGVHPKDAAIMGVIIHGKAGDFAAKKLSMPYMVASDIISEISTVFLSFFL